MNPQSNDVPEARQDAPAVAPTAISPARRMYWSVRRELWENRSIYVAPLIAAGVFLVGVLINITILRHRMHDVWTLSTERQYHLISNLYDLAAALIMGTGFIVGIFYTLDALYGERRDRSIFFWKSLPVSDLTTVLSKLSIPLIILPLVTFAISIVTQWIMLVVSSIALLGSGADVSMLWARSPSLHFSVMLLYHILTVHGLWYAPFYGWLLLVSAWARRAPFLWAFLPPFVIYGIEKLAFNTSYFLAILEYRVTGPENPAAATQGSTMTDVMAALTPVKFFSTPGLWTGLALAAIFIAAAVRVRRCRGPI
jgi:ABC-2 type transport system permease protein